MPKKDNKTSEFAPGDLPQAMTFGGSSTSVIREEKA